MGAELGDLVNDLCFHIRLTVPAIWEETERGKMRQAVERAGILNHRLSGTPDFSFISEPEAAAFASLQTEFADRPGLCPGDTFTVLDVGGA
jgi:molecular chaperone DnaK (HSP70)